MTGKIVNFTLFQSLWFACVVGAAKNTLLPGLVVITAMLAWHSLPENRRPGDMRLAAVAVVGGALLDSFWVHAGLMTFSTAVPHAGVAPLWILMLWAGFSLTLNHSLAWLQKHYFLAALFAAIASPLSYLAGEKLGAVTFTADIAVTATAVSVAWAAALPALLFLAKRWLNQQPGSRDLWALSR